MPSRSIRPYQSWLRIFFIIGANVPPSFNRRTHLLGTNVGSPLDFCILSTIMISHLASPHELHLSQFPRSFTSDCGNESGQSRLRIWRSRFLLERTELRQPHELHAHSLEFSRNPLWGDKSSRTYWEGQGDPKKRKRLRFSSRLQFVHERSRRLLWPMSGSRPDEDER